MGEEYGFRGYLMQAFGSLTRSLRVAIVAHRRCCSRWPTALQNFPLFFDRFAFGLIAGLIVILVGGLEAGIALHILNNLLAFGVAIALDQLDEHPERLRGVLVAAAADDHAERRLPGPGAARRPQDGAAQHDRSAGRGSRLEVAA